MNELGDRCLRMLIARAQGRDERAAERIVVEFRGFAVSRTTGMFLPGGDRDDLIAEALVGLLKAIRDYRPGGSRFIHFAALCIDRQLITAVKTANREKHRCCNEAVTVLRDADGRDVPALDSVADPQPEIVDGLCQREVLEQVELLVIGHLSEDERIAYLGWLDGLSYEEIAAESGGLPKAVDRALQRAHWKIRGIGPPSSPELCERNARAQRESVPALADAA